MVECFKLPLQGGFDLIDTIDKILYYKYKDSYQVIRKYNINRFYDKRKVLDFYVHNITSQYYFQLCSEDSDFQINIRDTNHRHGYQTLFYTSGQTRLDMRFLISSNFFGWGIKNKEDAGNGYYLIGKTKHKIPFVFGGYRQNYSENRSFDLRYDIYNTPKSLNIVDFNNFDAHTIQTNLITQPLMLTEEGRLLIEQDDIDTIEDIYFTFNHAHTTQEKNTFFYDNYMLTAYPICSNGIQQHSNALYIPYILKNAEDIPARNPDTIISNFQDFFNYTPYRDKRIQIKSYDSENDIYILQVIQEKDNSDNWLSHDEEHFIKGIKARFSMDIEYISKDPAEGKIIINNNTYYLAQLRNKTHINIVNWYRNSIQLRFDFGYLPSNREYLFKISNFRIQKEAEEE